MIEKGKRRRSEPSDKSPNKSPSRPILFITKKCTQFINKLALINHPSIIYIPPLFPPPQKKTKQIELLLVFISCKIVLCKSQISYGEGGGGESRSGEDGKGER